MTTKTRRKRNPATKPVLRVPRALAEEIFEVRQLAADGLARSTAALKKTRERLARQLATSPAEKQRRLKSGRRLARGAVHSKRARR